MCNRACNEMDHDAERSRSMNFGAAIKRFFLKREPAVGVVEILLILVVLIALVILFKEQLTKLADSIFGNIFTKAESVF